MNSLMNDGTAIVLANGCFQTGYAKTAHGLVRGPSRYPIAAVIDAACAGSDAGTVLAGQPAGIPIYASVTQALGALAHRPRYCIVGVATHGGKLPLALRDELLVAADAGLTLVSGLHQLLGDDVAMKARVAAAGGSLIDIRRPRPFSELHFWRGEVLKLTTPRIAVLGTDCALGKRTTTQLLLRELRALGVRAEMIFTGQTGWLQGVEHGFIFDSTPNDFVCGELEHAIMACARAHIPDVILLEGQSALRNPSGPCGSELIVSGGAAGVILQHAPARKYYDGFEELGCAIPPVADEIDFIGRLGCEVWAVTLNVKGLAPEAIESTRAALAHELGLPVLAPLQGGAGELAAVVQRRLAQQHVRGKA